MYVSLHRKVLSASEKYADLVEKRIENAVKADCLDQEEFENILEGIRILHHAVVMLTKIDRLCNGSYTSGQEVL